MNPNKIVTCRRCGQKYVFKKRLKHLQKYHKILFKRQQVASGKAASTTEERCKICGKVYSGSNLLHKKNVHQGLFLRHQRQAFAALLRKDSNHQSKAGKIGGPIGGRLGMRTRFKRNPNVFSEMGHVGGTTTALTGKIVENRKSRRLKHQDHEHDSKHELFCCTELQETHVLNRDLYPDVQVGKNQFDWVIGSDINDSSTWREIIDNHKVRSWKGETSKSYKLKRRRIYRLLGLKCRYTIECY